MFGAIQSRCERRGCFRAFLEARRVHATHTFRHEGFAVALEGWKSHSPRRPWLTVYRGCEVHPCKMIRREGRLRVILRRHGRDWCQRGPLHRCTLGTIKSITVRDLTCGFLIYDGNSVDLLIADPAITARLPRKFVFKKLMRRQGPACTSIFSTWT